MILVHQYFHAPFSQPWHLNDPGLGIPFAAGCYQSILNHLAAGTVYFACIFLNSE
jgi:hypothetical protein